MKIFDMSIRDILWRILLYPICWLVLWPRRSKNGKEKV